jgi:hypothetical protein
VAPSTERGAAGLTAKGLDALRMAMCTIPNQGVDVSVRNPGAQALVIGTGEALGVHPFRGSPPTFDLAPGAHGKGRRPHNRRAGGGEATGRAIMWGTWLKEALDCGVPRCCSQLGRAMMAPGKVPKPRQGEHEAEHEEEQEQVKDHQDPRCLKLGTWEASL